MIRKFSLHNYKGFEDAELDLTNLNFFIGKNSVGKTAAISGLLFGAQVISMGGDSPLEMPLNGPLYSVYEPNALFNKSNSTPKFKISLETEKAIVFSSAASVSLGVVDVVLAVYDRAAEFLGRNDVVELLEDRHCRDLLEKIAEIKKKPWERSIHFTNIVTELLKKIRGTSIEEDFVCIKNEYKAALASSWAYLSIPYNLNELNLRNITVEGVYKKKQVLVSGLTVGDGSGLYLSYKFNHDKGYVVVRSSIESVKALMKRVPKSRFKIVEGNGVYDEPGGVGGLKIAKMAHAVYFDAVRSHNVRDVLRTLLHITPLRAHPKPYYSVYDGGSNYFDTYDDSFIVRLLDKNDSLLESINFWLRRLGHEVSVDVISSALRAVRVKSFDVQLNIVDVGFGVSQIVPILGICLAAPQGALIVVEQPEIHLHPAAQADLADFFIEIAKSGRRLIVETHSEALLRRVRRRLAEMINESGYDDVKRFVSIFGFERRDVGCVVNRVTIGDRGNFQLPREFLDYETEDVLGYFIAQERRRG